MALSALILVLGGTVAVGGPPSQYESVAAAEQYIREVIGELPLNSALRDELLHGARGDGVRYPWMEGMREQGIKQVVVWIGINFNWRGRPKRMNVKRIQYFTQYDEGAPILSADRLNAIRASGLEMNLDAIALEGAARSAWVDVPRPRPHPFVGGIRLTFFDDEWLPTTYVGLYYTGIACLSESK
jgi:hypothetical protein